MAQSDQGGFSVKLSTKDLLSHVFERHHDKEHKPLYINAAKPAKSVSFNQARSNVRRLIGGLRDLGVKPGDVVCMHCHNSIYYALLYLAIIGCGARWVGTNPAYTASELAHVFSITRTSWIIIEPALLEKILTSCEECDISPSHMIAFDAEEGPRSMSITSWRSLLDHDEEDWIAFDDEETAKSTVAAMLTTSGTTGLPKAAEISHHALVAQSQLINMDTEHKPYQIRRLLSLPQFHAFAGPLMNISPLLNNIPTYIMKRFSMDGFVDLIEKYDITETAIVNPILLGLVSLDHARQQLLQSLRTVWIAGARLDGDTQNKLQDILHSNARICQVWGMTEIGWISTTLYPEKDVTGAVGRLLPDFEARILDEFGAEVTDDNVAGELLVKGPSMMTGYLSNSEATAETIIDGWLRTGDIGYQKEGKIYINDRVKDIIKVRGWQVSPAEVEACLLTHAYVVDAAVVGVNPTGQGEVPCAYIVVNPSVDAASDEELMEYLGSRLAKYKLPTGGIRRVGSIPRSNAGKILKNLLRERRILEISQPKGPVSVHHEAGKRVKAY